MKSRTYLANSPSQTKKLGEALAEKILKSRPKNIALVIGLKGDLGGGKTTFLQGFARGLRIKQKILSPTFILMKKFQIPNCKFQTNYKTFFHFDCYRINKPKEILDLGFKKVASNSENVVAIEWVERVKRILPKDSLIIKFHFIDPVRDSKGKKRGKRRQVSNGVDKNNRKIVFEYAK